MKKDSTRIYPSTPSKRTVLGNLAAHYILGILPLWLGLSMLSEFKKTGCYTDHKHGFRFCGDPALFTIHGVIVGSLILLLFSVRYTVWAVGLFRRGSFGINPPRFVICTTCLEPFDYIQTQEFKCPRCGGRVEDTRGFYARHPELGTVRNPYPHEATSQDLQKDREWSESNKRIQSIIILLVAALMVALWFALVYMY
jgi:hypothetical protein